MKKNILMVSLLSAMSSSYALDNTVDPRSLAMGGAGVAGANGYNVLFQNPAVLSGLPNEKFTAQSPFAMRASDEGDFANNVDALNLSATAMSNAFNAFSAAGPAQKQSTAIAAGNALIKFNGDLGNLSNKALAVSLYGGGFAAIPRTNLGYAFKFDARSELGTVLSYSAADQAAVNSLGADLKACGANPGVNVANCNNANTQMNGGTIAAANPTVNVRAAVVQDFGLSLARHIETEQMGGFEIGITPKFLRVGTIDVASSAQSGNAKTTMPTGLKYENAFTIDLGASKTVVNAKGHDMKMGVVVKNLIPKTLKTTLNNNIEIAPQLTTGVAYGTPWFTGAVDLDVMKNKALITGLTKESQFLRMGAEFDAKGWAQLRVGYRHDLAGNYAGLPSLGLGLNLKIVNMDLSVASAGKKELAAALQFGTHF